MQQKNRIAYILEIIWLIVTILAFGVAVHSIVTRGLKESAVLILIVFLPLGIYLLRRNSRKN